MPQKEGQKFVDIRLKENDTDSKTNPKDSETNKLYILNYQVQSTVFPGRFRQISIDTYNISSLKLKVKLSGLNVEKKISFDVIYPNNKIEKTSFTIEDRKDFIILILSIVEGVLLLILLILMVWAWKALKRDKIRDHQRREDD